MWGQIVLLSKDYFILVGYGIALIAALRYYKGYFDTPLKFLPILIAYTFLNELLGILVKTYPQFSFFEDLEFSSFNDIIYNIYTLVFFSFFYFVYWKLQLHKKYKKWIVMGTVFMFLSYLVSLFYQNPFDTNLYYATAIASWVLLLCIALYFLDKHRQKEKLVQPHNLMFWISLSLLLFYFALPILLLIGYLDTATWEHYNLRTVLRILIVVMCAIQTIGFFKGRRQRFN